MEAPPLGSDALKKGLLVNAQLVHRPGGRLPPLAEDAVRLFAIGGNHTNAFLRCVKAGALTPVAGLTEDGSRLSLKRMADQPDFVSAVTKGLTWTVISYKVEMQIPGFVDFVQPPAASPPPRMHKCIFNTCVHTRYTHG